jgi:hypothetical protein
MSVKTYWKGEGIQLNRLWRDFDDGSAYVEKVATSRLHVLRLTFAEHPPELPLFDFEVVFKTVKGSFHDVKRRCLPPEQYFQSAPIFLHRVDRGSGIFEFLAEFDPLMTWIVALAAAAHWYRSQLSADQKSDETRFEFIKRNFPNASPDDVLAYMKAWTTFGRRRVLHRLIGQRLIRVEVSAEPLRPQQRRESSGSRGARAEFLERLRTPGDAEGMVDLARMFPFDHEDDDDGGQR